VRRPLYAPAILQPVDRRRGFRRQRAKAGLAGGRQQGTQPGALEIVGLAIRRNQLIEDHDEGDRDEADAYGAERGAREAIADVRAGRG